MWDLEEKKWGDVRRSVDGESQSDTDESTVDTYASALSMKYYGMVTQISWNVDYQPQAWDSASWCGNTSEILNEDTFVNVFKKKKKTESKI